MKPTTIEQVRGVCARAVVFCLTAAGLTVAFGAAQDIQPYKAAEVQPYEAGSVRPQGQTAGGRAGAAKLEALRCSGLRCEAGQDMQHRAPVVNISGAKAEAASKSLILVVFDENKRIVSKDSVTADPDGSFVAAIPTFSLPAGAYRFDVVNAAERNALIAAGAFTLTREASETQQAGQGTEPVRKKGFAGFLERLDANAKRAQADPAVSGNQQQGGAGAAAGFFFRTFGLAIPGVAYTTDNYATNTRTVTVASGTVTKSAVRVNPDGTYVWNSAWDGKMIRGQWRRQGSAIILLHAQSGLDWRMERMDQPQGKAVITLWDQNSIWYHGTPIE